VGVNDDDNDDDNDDEFDDNDETFDDNDETFDDSDDSDDDTNADPGGLGLEEVFCVVDDEFEETCAGGGKGHVIQSTG
jgi:hypothetical protein